MSDNKYQMVAKTFQGLEEILRDELISLGAENVEMGRRMVSFEGDLEIMYKANLCCRTALRILKPIEKFSASDPDELYDIVRDIEWEKYMTPDTTFSIDSTVNSEEFPHSKYVTYRVKDGIVDHFRDKYGERPSIRVVGADLVLNVHIFDDRITISLDSSGEPLSKRGYRVEQTAAPINEVLAAGIIMMTGWRGDCNFADPMCGSGTFLIEAALIAANINPGIYRKQFAFEKWPDFDKELFEDIYNDDSAEKDFDFKIYGGDMDPEAVAIARKNIREAKVEDMIEIACKPLSDWTDNPEPGVIVTNPPYGERLKPEDMAVLYKGIGTSLKQNFPGWHAWIIGLNDDDFHNIGLKPTIKIPLLNGSLECSLREYVMFDGRYADFRADGGSVGRFADEEEEKRPRKMKRITDDEWKKETRKFGHSRDKGKDFRPKSKPQRAKGFDSDDFDVTPSFKPDRKFDRSDRKFGKPDGKFDRGDRKFGKPDGKFDHGDRKFGKPDGKFDRGDRKFGKPDGKFDRGDRKFGKSDRPDNRFSITRKKERADYIPADKGPSIPESNATVFSRFPVRSRRPKQDRTDD